MSKVIDILVNGNSDVVNKSPVIVLTKVNIKIKMDHAKFLLKSSCTKWISFKSWFQTLEIGQNYMRFVCWTPRPCFRSARSSFQRYVNNCCKFVSKNKNTISFLIIMKTWYFSQKIPGTGTEIDIKIPEPGQNRHV